MGTSKLIGEKIITAANNIKKEVGNVSFHQLDLEMLLKAMGLF